jgi:predicted GH43/DUF377 family glycosyl hydrolase
MKISIPRPIALAAAFGLLSAVWACADIARLNPQDIGIVLKHGSGPAQCDALGARDLWIYQANGTYYMNYDGAGPTGWLACLATSKDLLHWDLKGPVLSLGAPGDDDSASASYGTTYFDGHTWHMYYMGTPHTTPPPDRIPAFPYLTRYASGPSPAGPWTKDKSVIPFSPKADTYYSSTASPGQIIRQGDEYLMFFSAATMGYTLRTIGIARTRDLRGAWTIDPRPILPSTEQIENTSLYFEPTNSTWFLFTNHIAPTNDYSASIVVYWSKDLEHWDPQNKAVVLDGKNCTWSHRCIGLPGVVRVGSRLGVLYDAPGGDSTSHMGRDIGLAWLTLPLAPPSVP